jgi:hypothetical protein
MLGHMVLPVPRVHVDHQRTVGPLGVAPAAENVGGKAIRVEQRVKQDVSSRIRAPSVGCQ